MADNQNDISGKVGLDTTDFKAGITTLNQQIRVVETGFKAAAAGMTNWGQNAEGLKSRIDALNKVTDLQKQKVSALKTEYERVAAESGANSKAARDLEIRINKETESLNKNQLELKQVTSALNNFGKETDQAADKSKRFDGALGKMGTSLKGIGGAVAKGAAVGIAAVGAAAASAAVGAFKLAEKASDLAEAQNVVQATFDETSESILNWSKTVAESAGISETNAVKYAGSMGAMLKSSGLSEQAAGDMSKSLVQLTGDFSSFYNMDNETAWEKIRSGIAGETEPLKQLGINMSVANMEAFALSKGIDASWNSMSQAEQTNLRYQYIMAKTADAQGDFGKTLETSFPNQMRVAKMQMESMATSMGQKFLPSFLGIFKSINEGFKTGDWSGVGTSLTEGFNQIMTEVSGFVQTGGPIAASLLSGIVASLTAAIPEMMPAFVAIIIQLIDMLAQLLIDNGPMLIESGIAALMSIIDGLTEALPKLIEATLKITMALIDGLINNLPKLVSAAIKIIVALATGLIQALPKLVEKIPEIITAIVLAIGQNLPQIIGAALNIIITLGAGLIKAIPTLLMSIPKIVASLIDAFAKVDWSKVGSDIMAGIGDGIKNAAKTLAKSAKDAAAGALTSTKKFLGIESPSKVFKRQVGMQIGAGMAAGISESGKMVDRAMSGMNKRMVGSVNVNAATSNGAPQSVGGVVVNVPLYMDGKLISNATGAIQQGKNRTRSRSIGVVPC